MSKVSMALQQDYPKQLEVNGPPPSYNFSHGQQPQPMTSQMAASSPWIVQSGPENPPMMAPQQYPQQLVGPPQTFVTSINIPGEVVAPMGIGPNPMRMTCPHCRAAIQTRTTKSPSTNAYIIGLVIALCGCIYGCCLIPCCMDSLMDVQHNCPNCQAYIGRFRQGG